MQVFEIWFRNQQLGESKDWTTDICVERKGEIFLHPAQYKCVEEINAQEQTWEAVVVSEQQAIHFAKFIAGVADLQPVSIINYDNQTRLYFEYEII